MHKIFVNIAFSSNKGSDKPTQMCILIRAFLALIHIKTSENDHKIPQSNTAENPWHRGEDPQNNNSHKTPGRQSKATNSLFPIKMIAKLERTQSNAQLNMEQTQNHKMGATVNNESTKTESPPSNGQQP